MRGTDVRVFINELDVSGDTAEVSVETTVEEYEAATLTSEIADYSPGINSGQININGYFNGVEDGFEDSFRQALGSATNLVMMLADFQNLPCPAYVCENAYNLNMVWTMPVDGLITIDGAFKAKRGVKRGKLLQYKTTYSSTGLGTSLQLVGVTSGMPGKAYVVVHSVGGTQTTPITLKVQSSANGTSGWSDKASFSFAAPGAQAIEVASPTGEFFGINITSLGGATSALISFVLSFDGLT